MLSPLGIKVWNGSLDLAELMEIEGEHVADKQPVAMRHLSYLADFDSAVMSNGLDEAMSRYSPERMETVSKACDYFGLHDLASLVRRLAASDHDYELAQGLNVEYWEKRGRRPGDSLIEAALEDRLRTSPQDFGIKPQDSL